MTGSDDFLARWSRRKQAVAEAEATPPDEPPPPEAASTRSDVAPDALVSDEPPNPLPRLEDVSAESDVTAFLRKGVPEGLKRAALRRAWSLDPAIRDFVGPAEYAWDYNEPGAMAGFGAAGAVAAAKQVVQAIGLGTGSPTGSGAPESGASLRPAEQVPAGGDDPGPARPSEAISAASSDTETALSSHARPRHGGAAPR